MPDRASVALGGCASRQDDETLIISGASVRLGGLVDEQHCRRSLLEAHRDRLLAGGQ